MKCKKLLNIQQQQTLHIMNYKSFFLTSKYLRLDIYRSDTLCVKMALSDLMKQ